MLPCRPPVSRRVVTRAEPSTGSSGDKEFTSLAPLKPKTPYGEMLQFYLKMQPELFRTAVETQLDRLKSEKEDRDAKRASSATPSDPTNPTQLNQADLALYRRMEEVRAGEMRATLEDLMYVSILEKFVGLGLELLPRMEAFVDAGNINLKALTEGVHSREALELVREHLLGVMGPAAQAQFSSAYIKTSRFQMAQMYAASILFGYFLRRVDSRFQLERVAGTLPEERGDTVARLEKLFSQADAQDLVADESSSTTSKTVSSASETSSKAEPPPSSSSSDAKQEKGVTAADFVSGGDSSSVPASKRKSALRRYVESFDQATMLDTARVVSAEGSQLVERQTGALLGDIKTLTQQVQDVVGRDAKDMQEVMTRMAKAVEKDEIETLTMSVGTQRRAVLEAVAFGSFLREVETHVRDEYGLLTVRSTPLLE